MSSSRRTTTWMPRHDPGEDRAPHAAKHERAPAHHHRHELRASRARRRAVDHGAARRDARAMRDTGAILATNPSRGEFSKRVTFAALVAPAGASAVSATGDRTAFLGRTGSVARPRRAALRCATRWPHWRRARSVRRVRAPRSRFRAGGTAEIAFLLGEAENESRARSLLRSVRRLPRDRPSRSTRCAPSGTRRSAAVQIETPSPALDLMVNGWLAYQNLACRVWGRSAYYQSGGAFGFRDQLQDSAALLYLDPSLTRAQIMLHASHQFVEGDVMHWWHPPTSKGIRTRFSDDLLWLPYITAFYVASTGDAVRARCDGAVRHGPASRGAGGRAVHDAGGFGDEGSVYEHCCRSIDRSLTAGVHGIPLMGSGDWNDGMNRVGREGKGESVWLGFFLFAILERVHSGGGSAW